MIFLFRCVDTGSFTELIFQKTSVCNGTYIVQGSNHIYNVEAKVMQMPSAIDCWGSAVLDVAG